MSGRIRGGLPDGGRFATGEPLPGQSPADLPSQRAPERSPIGAPSAASALPTPHAPLDSGMPVATVMQARWNSATFRAKPDEATPPMTEQKDPQAVHERQGPADVGSKALVQVPAKDKPQFEAARTRADNIREALRDELGERNRSTTLLAFVFRKKGEGGGSYEIGIAASGDAAAMLSGDPALEAIVSGLQVVRMSGDATGGQYPRFHRGKLDESTDQHAEQQALRWADARPDVDGIAYFAPTAQVCEGCLQSIYDKAPYDPGKQSFAFDPDETIAPQARSNDFFRKEILPAHLIPGGKERAIDASAHPPSAELATQKRVAEHFGISAGTLRTWVRGSRNK